jgi:hypothetical protein
MHDHFATLPEAPEVTLVGSAAATLADLRDLVAALPSPSARPGDAARAARIADRLAEELAECAAMLRALPGHPAALAGYDHQLLAALRTSHRSGEDIAKTTAHALARLAAELGSSVQVVANRPGSREAGLVIGLLSGTVGPHDENLGMFGASS